MAHTILIVDDSAVMRASIAFTLRGAGYEVVEAVEGKNGLALLRERGDADQRPALILTDVNMPVMDGLTFIAEVKKTAHRFVPILVLTTESEEKKKQLARDAGAAGWLVKPFKPEQLLAVVKKFIR